MVLENPFLTALHTVISYFYSNGIANNMNINFTDLEKLIKLAEGADIQSLEVTDGDARISIVCQPDGNDDGSNHPSRAPQAQTTHPQQPANTAHHNTSENNPDNTNVNSKHIDETVTDKTTETTDTQVLAPMLGTFYLRSEPTAEAFFKVGDHVVVGQTLCIIEAMKMMYEVKAETAGTLKEILVDEGDVVEYAQPLFITVPDS